MMFLGEYRDRAERLADHLPWAAMVAPGVVLNKDGSFLRVLAFRGPDLIRRRSRTGRRLRAGEQCAAPVRKRLGAVLRGRKARGAQLSGQRISRCGELAGRQ